MKELALTSTHYDKINTQVLKKSYRFIAGDDELEQLNFLSKKFMFNHLFHEIRQLKAKVINGEVNPENKDKYIRAIFDFSINVPAKYFNESFVNQNGVFYLSQVNDNIKAREFEVKAKMLFARLNSLTQKCPSSSVTIKMKKEIAALEKKYATVEYPEIKSILYHCWINFYRMLIPDWKKRTLYLEKIQNLYKKDNVPIFERAIYECHKAEVLYEKGEFAKAYLAYTKTFSSYMLLLRNQFHHFARWIELALILGLYSEAEQLLDSLFKVYVNNRHESNGVLGSLLYAEMYLLKNDFNNAFQYLSLAKSLNSIQVYFIYEIRIRMREALFFALNGDKRFVERLVQRCVRYIQLQKLDQERYTYLQFFRILKDYQNIKATYPDRLSSKSKELLKPFESGYEKLNELLLKKLLDKN
ncbi:MAG: hypothetical protein LH473_09440 [Chitinophagales bacterium]|nr:hypothetical protein [Chitinophagales bacterium]